MSFARRWGRIAICCFRHSEIEFRVSLRQGRAGATTDDTLRSGQVCESIQQERGVECARVHFFRRRTRLRLRSPARPRDREDADPLLRGPRHARCASPSLLRSHETERLMKPFRSDGSPAPSSSSTRTISRTPAVESRSITERRPSRSDSKVESSSPSIRELLPAPTSVSSGVLIALKCLLSQFGWISFRNGQKGHRNQPSLARNDGWRSWSVSRTTVVTGSTLT